MALHDAPASDFRPATSENLVVQALPVDAAQFVNKRVRTDAVLGVLRDRIDIELVSNNDLLCFSSGMSLKRSSRSPREDHLLHHVLQLLRRV